MASGKLPSVADASNDSAASQLEFMTSRRKAVNQDRAPAKHRSLNQLFPVEHPFPLQALLVLCAVMAPTTQDLHDRTRDFRIMCGHARASVWCCCSPQFNQLLNAMSMNFWRYKLRAEGSQIFHSEGQPHNVAWDLLGKCVLLTCTINI